MAGDQDNNASRPMSEAKTGDAREEIDRRDALTFGSTVAMAGGLAAGYGVFFAMAGRFFFPSGANTAWMFVASAESIPRGASIPFESPTGVRVTITRRSGNDEDLNAPLEESFLALSSICPHLGCRVHWEPHNDRFFCPCHNGVFDPDGRATAGPPAAANQDLPQYPLKVEDGALYIEMPFRSV